MGTSRDANCFMEPPGGRYTGTPHSRPVVVSSPERVRFFRRLVSRRAKTIEGGSEDAGKRWRLGASLPFRLPATPANDRRPPRGPAPARKVAAAGRSRGGLVAAPPARG